MTSLNVDDKCKTRKPVARALPALTASLLNDISAFVTDHVTLVNPESDAPKIAAWILHAAISRAGDYCSYLLINADGHDSGKTTLARIIGKILPDAILIAQPTVAALARIQADVVIVDQFDTLLKAKGTDRHALEGWLDSGHTRDFINPLSDPADITATVNRSAYGPKILCGIGIVNDLPDTVTSRCHIVRMRPQTLTEATRDRPTPDERDKAASALSKRIASWASASMPVIRDSIAGIRSIKISDNLTIFNRECDIWAPLISIAELTSDDEWRKRIITSAESSAVMQDAPITTADRMDAQLHNLFHQGRLTARNWITGKAPIPDAFDFPVTNQDLGFPAGRYSNARTLPEGRLIINSRMGKAELRFKAATFDSIAEAMGSRKREVTSAYRDAGRLHAATGKGSMPLAYQQGQSNVAMIAIDVSTWFWPNGIGE